jgi:hypothetical protein
MLANGRSPSRSLRPSTRRTVTPLRARGAGRRGAEPPAHLHPLRSRTRGRRRLPGDGARRGRYTARADERRRGAPACTADCDGACYGSSPWHRAPRHHAGRPSRRRDAASTHGPTSSVLARSCTRWCRAIGPLAERPRRRCSAPFCVTIRSRCGLPRRSSPSSGSACQRNQATAFRPWRTSYTRSTSLVVPRKEAPSIAVLPFTSMSADVEDEYFGDGVAEELINALTQLNGLHVAARRCVRSCTFRRSICTNRRYASWTRASSGGRGREPLRAAGYGPRGATPDTHVWNEAPERVLIPFMPRPQHARNVFDARGLGDWGGRAYLKSCRGRSAASDGATRA